MNDSKLVENVRTRIAPSPTGYPHIGTVYQALFDFAFAKKNSGAFVVRIEDTDRERFVEDAEEKIFQALDWFGLIENESPRKNGPYSPYRQSERLDIYKKYAMQLIEKGYAYYCFCSKQRLEEVRKKQQQEKKPMMYDKHCRMLEKEDIEKSLRNKTAYVIRLKVPGNETIVFHDELRGEVKFDSNLIDDQVLLKSDGFPTYHLAVVVDDHEMKITHIVRGEEWLPSTPKHVLIYRFLGWEMPPIYHTPALRNPDKSKLSKRQGHTNISWYQEEGYLAKAILNFLALLGWSHPEEKEIFDLEEFERLFELKNLKPIGPIFDLTKLTWMNGIYIREKLSAEELLSLLYDFDESLKEIDKKLLISFVEITKTRIKTLKEFKEMVWPFLHPTEKTLTPEEEEIKKRIRKDLKEITLWNIQTLSDVILQKYVLGKQASYKTLYKIALGTDRGLPLADTFAVIGKEKTVALFS